MGERAEHTRDELVAGHLVAALQDGGDWRLLYDVLGEPPGDPEAVRDALLLLADYDVRMVVQIALDALVESANQAEPADGFTPPARDEQLRGRRGDGGRHDRPVQPRA